MAGADCEPITWSEALFPPIPLPTKLKTFQLLDSQQKQQIHLIFLTLQSSNRASFHLPYKLAGFASVRRRTSGKSGVDISTPDHHLASPLMMDVSSVSHCDCSDQISPAVSEPSVSKEKLSPQCMNGMAARTFQIVLSARD